MGEKKKEAEEKMEPKWSLRAQPGSFVGLHLLTNSEALTHLC